MTIHEPYFCPESFLPIARVHLYDCKLCFGSQRKKKSVFNKRLASPHYIKIYFLTVCLALNKINLIQLLIKQTPSGWCKLCGDSGQQLFFRRCKSGAIKQIK